MELKFCAKSCFHWWKSIRDDNDVLCHLLEYYCPIVSQLLQVQFSIYCCVWTSNFDGIKWERCIAQFISASQHSAVVENDKVINNFVNVYGAQSLITIPVTRFWTRETSVANNNNLYRTDESVRSIFMDLVVSSLVLPSEETGASCLL